MVGHVLGMGRKDNSVKQFFAYDVPGDMMQLKPSSFPSEARENTYGDVAVNRDYCPGGWK